MRQRAMIAMALACDPDILIADEPTTALDVTIQAQILELMQEIQHRTNSAMILITHDLGVVADMADKVLVMYAGQARGVRYGRGRLLQPAPSVHLGALRQPAAATTSPTRSSLCPIQGQPPSLIDLPVGLSLQPALSLRAGRLPGEDTGAHDRAGGASVCLPLLR